jgi:apolipoprotein N-acyltransferase
VKRLTYALILAWGWRRRVIAFAAGALSALAMAPFNAWPILFLTFPALVWLIDGAAVGRWGGVVVAAATGWWFGFGYFVAGLYWIGYAFLVDAPTFGWLLPFAVIGLPAVLAVYTALGVAVARILWTRGAVRIVTLGATLTAVEWLRGHLFTGFPWNAFGYALTSPLAIAQSASVIGPWGLTFIVVCVCASPATLTDEPSETPRRWLPLAISIAVLAGLGGWGALRLQRTPTEYVDNVRLRIMQPNLQQDVRFNYAARQHVMERYIALSDQASGSQSRGVHDATLLIWPESPFPFVLTHEPEALAQIAKLLSPSTVLITGAIRVEQTNSATAPRAYNSIYVIGSDGSILDKYDKTHLVPFGEYLPFENFLEKLGLQNLTKQAGGFTPGDHRHLITVPGAPVALPLICYEVVFPGAVAPPGDRAGWIVNVTNDGWFGISTGPYEHFQQSRVQAIEEGLPLVRAANTGVSAVIDPLGRVVNSLALGQEGVLDARLPRPIAAPFYARVGDAPALALVVLGLLAALRCRFSTNKEKA